MPVGIETLLPLAGGFLAGLLALAAVLWLAPRERRERAVVESDYLSEPRWFRFRHGYLVEHSENVSFLLPDPVNHLKAWDMLSEALSDMSAEAPAAFEALRDTSRPFKLEGTFGRDRVLILGLRDGEDVRITVSTAEERQPSVRIDLPSLQAMESEIAMLARAGDASPTLAWAIDGDGRVIWSNKGYLDMIGRCAGPDAARGWPLHALFPDGWDAPPGKNRRKVRDRQGEEHWFEVKTTAPDADGLRHVNAQSLDAVIKAEESLRTFIQTLTRSFAFLPTGLAIFDRQGQLALFNPALLDITGLDAAWLSRRPRLSEFFDSLRDRQKLPEPRDYKAWRDALTGPAQGGDGLHVETWTLADGTTYRVTGRPQGDGAVTLLLEDVSEDVSAGRARRVERDMLTGLLDDVDEALVAFDAEGATVLANAAAREMWMGDETGRMPATMEGCIAFWKTLGLPGAIWSDLRDFARSPQAERSEWTEILSPATGPDVALRVTPLPHGRIALGFRSDFGAAEGVRVPQTPTALHA